MTETLLSTSNVLLFGRVVEDLNVRPSHFEVKVASIFAIPTGSRRGRGPLDKVRLKPEDLLLLVNQDVAAENGIYRVGGGTTNAWTQEPDQPQQGQVVVVRRGKEGKGRWRRSSGDVYERLSKSLGSNRFLEQQFVDAVVARIYGFSYEGAYYDLPRPTLFVVHGNGEPAVLPSQIETANPPPSVTTRAQLARAPQAPSVTGMAAADFQFSDDIRVWSYDKADYTIRMDVETGMFEQVLLDAYFSDGAHVSGMKVAGSRVSGMKVSGMKVSGMKVAGSRLGRGDASD